MKTFQKPLTQGEEAEYIRLLREGTPAEARGAKGILIERNLRLVAHIAKKYQNSDEDMEDLISIGCIGLIKAIDTFDDRKGRLATYACRCIDNELLMLLRGKKKISREVSLFEPIGQDKEGNEIHLVDVIEQQQPDIIETVGKYQEAFCADGGKPDGQGEGDPGDALRAAGEEGGHPERDRIHAGDIQKLCEPDREEGTGEIKGEVRAGVDGKVRFDTFFISI